MIPSMSEMDVWLLGQKDTEDRGACRTEELGVRYSRAIGLWRAHW